MDAKSQQSVGAERVRLDSNPSSNSAAKSIKSAAVTLINAIHEAEGDPRLKALAMTAAEESAMWGVKAVTAPESP